MLDTLALPCYTPEKFREILPESFHVMLRITQLTKQTGATVDEIRYLEAKGFIKSERTKLKKREVRQFEEDCVRTVECIIKYRRQGFTWKSAYEKARQEIDKPTLF